MGRFGSSSDPWFRLGNFDVTTTIFMVGAGLMSMFVWAAEGNVGPLTRALLFDSNDVLGAQIWRLVTWPLPNDPSIWTVIMLAVLFMLGSQLESRMGRRPFTFLVGALVLIPALVSAAVGIIAPVSGIFGWRFVELGILVAFAAAFPTARFFFGIPAWAIAGVIVVVDALQLISARGTGGLIFFAVLVAVALIGIRSLGFADEVEWIPSIALPASLTGQTSRPTKSQRAQRSVRSTGKSHLRSVPAPTDNANEALNDREIDELLDQVSANGIDSLTKAQRKRLEDHSKRLRKRDGR